MTPAKHGAHLAVEVVGMALESADVASVECADERFDPLVGCPIQTLKDGMLKLTYKLLRT